MSEAVEITSSSLLLWAADSRGLETGRRSLPPDWDVLCTTEVEAAYPGTGRYGLVIVLPEQRDRRSQANVRAMLHRWEGLSSSILVGASGSRGTAWLEDIPGWTPCREGEELASLVAFGRVRSAMRQMELLVTRWRRSRVVLRRTLAATGEHTLPQPSMSQLATRLRIHRSTIAREWHSARAEGLM